MKQLELQKNDKDGESKAFYSYNERLFLTITDFLMIVMIIVDLLYWGEYLIVALDVLVVANVVMVVVSFVAYQQKKRILKRRLRSVSKDKTEK